MIKIACIGEQCSGKTSLAKFFMPEFIKHYHMKLADPIYQALEALKQPKHRAFMQQFGDLAKKHFGTEIFAEIFVKRVKELEAETKRPGFIPEGGLPQEIIPQFAIINDDTRFLYEVNALREIGFVFVAIECSTEVRKQRSEAQGFEFIENHGSEREIKDLIPMADYVISDGEMSLEDLGKMAQSILNDIVGCAYYPE